MTVHSRVKDFKMLTRIVAILVTVFMVAVSFIAPSFSQGVIPIQKRLAM